MPLFTNGIPKTRTKTSYSLTLHATVGNKRGVIGAVHEISYSQNLRVDELFEVNKLSKGLPRELVPQIVAGRTITLARYDLYTQTIEQVFGNPELITLADQIGPVSMRLMWARPEGQVAFDPSFLQSPDGIQALASPTGPLKIDAYEFVDCWITTLGRTVSTQNVLVGTNASIVWRDIKKLT